MRGSIGYLLKTEHSIFKSRRQKRALFLSRTEQHIFIKKTFFTENIFFKNTEQGNFYLKNFNLKNTKQRPPPQNISHKFVFHDILHQQHFLLVSYHLNASNIFCLQNKIIHK